MEELSTTQEFTEALSKAGDKPVFVMFMAKWCEPCTKIDSNYNEFAKPFSSAAIFYKVCSYIIHTCCITTEVYNA